MRIAFPLAVAVFATMMPAAFLHAQRARGDEAAVPGASVPFDGNEHLQSSRATEEMWRT